MSRKSFLSCIYEEYLYTSRRNKGNPLKILYLWLIGRQFRANVWISYMQKVENGLLKKLIKIHLEKKYSILIYETCSIGKHFRAEHLNGIVIGEHVIIGDYCKIYQQVTLGQKHGKYPSVGDRVIIYPGAKIIGGIKIGSDAIIGANAVVLHDVPEGSVVAGCPARVIKKRGHSADEG